MLEKIKQKYSGFSNAAIQEVNYNRYLAIKELEDGMIEIILKTEIGKTDYEIVKLTFLGIHIFRFLEVYKTNGLAIKEALLKREKNIITLDFSQLLMMEGFSKM